MRNIVNLPRIYRKVMNVVNKVLRSLNVKDGVDFNISTFAQSKQTNLIADTLLEV